VSALGAQIGGRLGEVAKLREDLLIPSPDTLRAALRQESPTPATEPVLARVWRAQV
jgi:hypothetical protein